MPFFAYILQCADNTFYIGSTNNVEKRVHTHNNLKSAAKYTKARRPVTLLYSEQVESYHEARAREAQLKRMSRKEKEEFLKKINKE